MFIISLIYFIITAHAKYITDNVYYGRLNLAQISNGFQLNLVPTVYIKTCQAIWYSTVHLSTATCISKNITPNFIILFFQVRLILGTAVAQWLRCCTTNRKVAGSIPAGVIGIFY